MPFLRFFLGLVLAQILHLAAMGAAGASFGAKPRIVRLGFGPVVFRRNVRGIELALGPVLLGGHVQFQRVDDDLPAPAGTRFFDELSGSRRAASQLAGPLALIVVGAALTALAGGQTGDALRSAWVNIFRGALAPTSTGKDLLGALFAAARAWPFRAFCGAIFLQIAAWNLLPLPPLNGGAALLDLAFAKPENGKGIRGAATILGFLVTFYLVVAWAVALVTFLAASAAG